jgi:hypothetical protein
LRFGIGLRVWEFTLRCGIGFRVWEFTLRCGIQDVKGKAMCDLAKLVLGSDGSKVKLEVTRKVRLSSTTDVMQTKRAHISQVLISRHADAGRERLCNCWRSGGLLACPDILTGTSRFGCLIMCLGTLAISKPILGREVAPLRC